MTHYVLDTNIISGLIRRDGQLITKMSEVVTQKDIILGCPMIWYEIRRGLLAKDAKLQLQIFELLF